MESKHVLIALLLLLIGGALGWTFLSQDDTAGVVNWSEADEVAVTAEELQAQALQSGTGEGVTRAEVAGRQGDADDAGASRPQITIRGRVVNKHQRPVENAKVNLSAWGRGWNSRITKEVQTADDGTFALAGKGFSNLRVTLQITHPDYALGTAFKNFSSAKGDVDMGDVTIHVGGSILGSVTDMQGNAIPDATAELSPMDRGFIFGRGGQSQNLPKVVGDRNGSFRLTKVPPGRYRVTASAPHRQREGQGPITVVDEQESRINPIQLGPGFEITGVVQDADGKPLKDADVSIRGSDRRNREQNTRTNEKGEFAFAHLAPGEYGVRARAKGYLVNEEHQGIDVTKAPPVVVTLQTGLRVTGVVTDGLTGRPVTRYAARIQRVASLPDPEADRRRTQERELRQKFEALMTSIRERGERTEADAQAMEALRNQLREAGGSFRGGRGGVGGGRGGFGRDGGGRGGFGRDGGGRGGFGRDGGGRGGFGRDGGGRGGFGRDGGGRGRGGFGRFGGGAWNADFPGDPGEVTDRTDGRFEFLGLEEGLYVVDIGSPDHQRLRCDRFEVRRGVPAPTLELAVQRGLQVAGKVFAKSDKGPLRDAEIELRRVVENTDTGAAQPRSVDRGPGRGRRGGDMFRQLAANNGPRTTRLLGARSGPDGSFKIPHAPPGKYVLRAVRDGFTPVSTDPFELKADATSFELALGALGVLEGRVTGLAVGKEASAKVIAYSSSPRAYRDADVNPDGTYEITDLEPGGYIVRAFQGDSQSFVFRQMFGNRGRGNTGEQQPPPIDVQIREGGRHHLIVAITAKTTGTVRGQVLVNGKGATGYRASLQRLDEQPEPEDNAGRRGRRGMGLLNSSSVDQNGRFEITEVEMGRYAITISPSSGGRGWGRGGFGTQSQVSRQIIQVHPDAVTEVPVIAIELGSIAGQLTVPVDPKATSAEPAKPLDPTRLRASLALYKGITELPEPGQPGADDVLRIDVPVRDGKFESKHVPTGQYLVLLRVRNRQTTTRSVYIGSGEETRFDIEVGPARPTNSPGSENPRGPGSSGPPRQQGTTEQQQGPGQGGPPRGPGNAKRG